VSEGSLHFAEAVCGGVPRPLGLAGAGGSRGWPETVEGGWPRPRVVLARVRAAQAKPGDGGTRLGALTRFCVGAV
jgi:hypothetical protein